MKSPQISVIDSNIQKDLWKLAVEIWKVEKRLQKLDQKLSENDKKWFSFLMERIYSALEKYGIHITDYTGQKYIEGMNGIDIVSVEAQEGLEQVIGEIISPTVEINGEIAQRAKAIIKDLKTFEEEKIANTTEKKADQRKKKIHWKKLVGYTIVVTILLWTIRYFCKEKFQSKSVEQTPMVVESSIIVQPPTITQPELTEEIQEPEIIKTPVEESKYPLMDFKEIVEVNQLSETKLNEIKAFTPHKVFKTLRLHRNTDKIKFGIVPWSAENNLQIRDILIDELRKHLK